MKISQLPSGRWMIDIPNSSFIEPTLEDALIRAEKMVRTVLDEVQKLLTAERDRLHAERR